MMAAAIKKPTVLDISMMGKPELLLVGERMRMIVVAECRCDVDVDVSNNFGF